MQIIDQAVDGGRCILFGDVGQTCIACGCGRTGMAEQALDMTQAQALFEQVCGKGVAQGMNRDLFFIPHSASNTFSAFWAPPRSMGVAALRMRSGEPTELGNSKRGLRCLHHKARSARQVRSGSGTRRSLWPLPRRICTCLRCAVDIADFKRQCLTQTQAHRIRGQQKDPVTELTCGTDQLLDFGQGENIRQ